MNEFDNPVQFEREYDLNGDDESLHQEDLAHPGRIEPYNGGYLRNQMYGLEEHHLYHNDYHPESDNENVSVSWSERYAAQNPNPSFNNMNNSNSQNLQKNESQYSNSLINQRLPEAEDKELMTITVEIGNGENENIVIMHDDTPDAVAARF
jgi:hypothetical protein